MARRGRDSRLIMATLYDDAAAAYDSRELYDASRNALRDSREFLAGLVSGSWWSTYSGPGGAISTPAVIIEPDSPYLTWQTLSNRFRIHIRLVCAVNNIDANSALYTVEQLAFDVLALLPAGTVVGDIGPPSQLTIGSLDLLTLDIPITLTESD